MVLPTAASEVMHMRVSPGTTAAYMPMHTLLSNYAQFSVCLCKTRCMSAHTLLSAYAHFAVCLRTPYERRGAAAWQSWYCRPLSAYAHFAIYLRTLFYLPMHNTLYADAHYSICIYTPCHLPTNT
eukprot:1655246-Rhodomonas_salina.1